MHARYYPGTVVLPRMTSEGTAPALNGADPFVPLVVTKVRKRDQTVDVAVLNGRGRTYRRVPMRAVTPNGAPA